MDWAAFDQREILRQKGNHGIGKERCLPHRLKVGERVSLVLKVEVIVIRGVARVVEAGKCRPLPVCCIGFGLGQLRFLLGHGSQCAVQEAGNEVVATRRLFNLAQAATTSETRRRTLGSLAACLCCDITKLSSGLGLLGSAAARDSGAAAVHEIR